MIYSSASIQTPEKGQWIYNTAAVHYAEEFYLHDVTKDNVMKFFSGRERDWDCRKQAWIDDSHEDEGVYVLRIKGSGNLPFYWFMFTEEEPDEYGDIHPESLIRRSLRAEQPTSK